jgi:2OG-Fe(II) oxygenase superfamily
LEQLAQACDAASFGRKNEAVLDENYRKAGKMDLESFALPLDLAQTDLIKIVHGYLLEGAPSTVKIKPELYKLNVYGSHTIFYFLFVSGQTRNECRYSGKGSFFKPHVDTPRSEMMFGSLVIVFPTPHEGGGLFLRHRGHEWIFDSGKELTDAALEKRQPSIAYVAFFSDIEHEVAPVISGYRVTLTFNLYIDASGPVSAKDMGSEQLSSPSATNEPHQELADGSTVASG